MQSFSPNQQLMNRPSAGILSRLFGGKSQAVSNGANVAPTGSMLRSIQQAANPSSISSMMTNVQKVLKAAESVGPMVQQYGPMVKNVPAMFKIYKALTSDSDTEKAAIVKTDENKNANLKEQDLHDLEADVIEQTPSGASKPKLYI
jgi:hypothetical protein